MTTPNRLVSGLAIAVPLLIEALFLQRYAAEAASWHWYVHLFAGATLALVLMTAWSRRHGRAVRFPLVWVVLAHLYAAIPDLLIPENVPHQRWQNVFAGHVAAHYLPGGGATWLTIAALALAGYLLALDRLRQPRR
jgi:hypothetical protein